MRQGASAAGQARRVVVLLGVMSFLILAVAKSGDARWAVVVAPRAVPPPTQVRRLSGAVQLLAADGDRVALATSELVGDNLDFRIEVWTPGSYPALIEEGKTSAFVNDYWQDLALAGSRVAWVYTYVGNGLEESPQTASIGSKRVTDLPGSYYNSAGGDPGGTYVGNLYGAGNLIVLNTWSHCNEFDANFQRDPACHHGASEWVSNGKLLALTGTGFRVLARGDEALWASDVDHGRIVVREDNGSVRVIGAGARGGEPYAFGEGPTFGARASRDLLVVLTAQHLFGFSLADHHPRGRCSLGGWSSHRTLEDALQNLAVVVEHRRVLRIIRIDDCRELRLASAASARIGAAALSDAGLFYSIKGRTQQAVSSVAFVPLVDLLKAFH
jgi:hypothetical protein